MEPVTNAGKRATSGAKIETGPSGNNLATGTKRGKIGAGQATTDFGLLVIG